MYLYIKYSGPGSVKAEGFAVFANNMKDQVDAAIARANKFSKRPDYISRRNVDSWDDVRDILAHVLWKEHIDEAILSRFGRTASATAHGVIVFPSDVEGLKLIASNKGWKLMRVGDSDAYSVSLRIPIAYIEGM